MADNLPQNFAVPGETSVVSYNYTDIASGTGMIKYYGIALSGGDRALVNNNQESHVQSTNGDYITGSVVQIPTTVFTLPQELTGTAYIRIQMYYSGAGTRTVTFKLQKYDGSTYTDLSSSSTLTFNSAGASNSVTLVNSIDITGDQLIQVGEQLVLHATPGAACAVYSNQVSNGKPFELYVPFKIYK